MTAGLETFAKVRTLHDRTDSPGEKAAAAMKMQTLARKAGMSTAEAISKLDAPVWEEPNTQAQAAADAFNDFFNTPEFRAERAERERARLARCAVLLGEYGSEDAVWADTEMEAALRLACEPLLGPGETWNTIYRLAGWGICDARSKMPDRVRRAVSEAWPLPTSTADAWAEYAATEKLDSDRATFCRDYTPHTWSEARRYIVEGLCQTLPARSLRDIRARLSWMEHVARLDMARSWEEQEPALTTLRADIERLGARIRGEGKHVKFGHEQGPAQPADPLRSPDPVSSTVTTYPARRTNSDKRRAVLALLNAEISGTEPLSDREIARKAGVSPQTVGNIKRAMR